ncbi:MAG: DUF1566 domain-containing protein [Nitrosomonadales bacterium]|nr:DUF1566 domain-containing protein [Nitrosomonadales bacterium]
MRKGWLSLLGLAILMAGTTISEAGATSRLEPHGGEVIDAANYLIWARCSIGQQWKEEVGCVGEVKNLTRDEALQAATDGWRLPLTNELSSLIDENRAFDKLIPTINEDLFPGMDWDKLAYWTNSPYGRFDFWRVHFDIGKAIPYGDPRMVKAAVRLVKDIPKPKKEN